MRRFGILTLILLVLITSASAAARFKQGVLTITQDAKRVVLQVEVADTPEARSQGLMLRESLAANAGMLFIFDEQAHWGFWMSNTLIPLSIAFIDEDWRIVDMKDMKVAPNPRKGPFEIYNSAEPFKYALEVNRGYFETKGIGIGAKVRLELKKSKQ